MAKLPIAKLSQHKKMALGAAPTPAAGLGGLPMMKKGGLAKKTKGKKKGKK